MKTLHSTLGMALAALCTATLPFTAAAAYPEQPVRMVVNFPPGGPLDTVARLVAQHAQQSRGWTVLVENKAGASGNIGAEQVVRAKPDGQTLLMTIDTVATVNPAAYGNMRFDPLADLKTLGIAGLFTQVLVAHPGLGVTDFAGFVEKARSENLSFASAGVGSPGHLPFELLKQRLGLQGTHIAYRGNAPALVDLVAGQVPVGFLALPTALSFIASDKLVPLMVPGEERDPALPAVPTAKEVGLEDFDVEFAFVLMAPAQVGEDVAQAWQTVLEETLADPATRETLAPLSIRPEVLAPAAATEWLRHSSERWGKLVRDEGIRLE